MPLQRMPTWLELHLEMVLRPSMMVLSENVHRLPQLTGQPQSIILARALLKSASL